MLTMGQTRRGMYKNVPLCNFCVNLNIIPKLSLFKKSIFLYTNINHLENAISKVKQKSCKMFTEKNY